MKPVLQYSLLSVAVFVVLLAAACSSSFVASSNAKPQDIFDTTCAGCHKPLAQHPDKYFTLSDDKLNTQYVADHIMHGSMLMPSYPHITGDELAALSQFAIDHSIEK